MSTLLEHPTVNDIDPKRVRSLFQQSHVLVLGSAVPNKDPSSPRILTFMVDDDKGNDRVMLPIFTSRDALRQGLLLNKEWTSLAVFGVDGHDLLPSVPTDVTVVIDPWTPLQYVLPSTPEPASDATSGQTHR